MCLGKSKTRCEQAYKNTAIGTCQVTGQLDEIRIQTVLDAQLGPSTVQLISNYLIYHNICYFSNNLQQYELLIS